MKIREETSLGELGNKATYSGRQKATQHNGGGEERVSPKSIGRTMGCWGDEKGSGGVRNMDRSQQKRGLQPISV